MQACIAAHEALNSVHIPHKAEGGLRSFVVPRKYLPFVSIHIRIGVSPNHTDFHSTHDHT
jgi:hypothetical protein